jgi:hypothetical protein
VPIIVAINAEEKAMISVVDRAAIISSFRNNSMYQLNVKPPHFARDFDLLKESIINIMIGA